MLSEGCTNVSEHFPRISEVVRRLPRKIRRFFDLISIYFGSFSIGTWQTLQADWSKMISHMCGYHFYPHIGIPFFSICYHSLKHCSLYNNMWYHLATYVSQFLKTRFPELIYVYHNSFARFLKCEHLRKQQVK